MDALILGCNGLVGRAIAYELAAAGWHVTGTGRDADRLPGELAETGIAFARANRYDGDELSAVVGNGFDLVVDCLCYTAGHARQILAHEQRLGHLVLISSKAVYVDAEGRHSNSANPPDFGAPVTERQSIMQPDWSGDYQSRTGYGANKVAAEQTALASPIPVTVLRPSRIHGRGSARPREWFFVRRLLDGRARVPLAHNGDTANHPTAAANIARLTRACAEAPSTRVLNVADPDAPTARDIAAAVARACNQQLEVVGLPDTVAPDLGLNPWSTWPPYLLDTSAAEAVRNYEPLSYADAVRDAVTSLLDLGSDQRDALNADPYFASLFDYTQDDRALALRP